MNTYLIICTCGATYNKQEVEGNGIDITCKCGKKIVIREYIEECKI